jgi:hypothetical protein
MIVHNLDFKGIRTSPAETNAPLLVDPNAVLPLAIAAKGLQAIAGNGSKIGQYRSRLNVVKLPFRHDGNTLKSPAEFAAEHLLGLPVPERPDHISIVVPPAV